jgi:hypothetical protein
MALHPELARMYSSAPDNSVIYDAIVLECSAWPDSVAVMNKVITDTTKNFPAGTPKSFQPANFGLTKPKDDDSGVLEISIELDVSAALYVLLEEAEKIEANITATFITYVDNHDNPANDPYVLTLDAVTVTETKVSFKARNSGLIDRAFPYRFVTEVDFPGLSR